MIALALDPGRTTGFAIASFGSRTVLSCGQLELSPRGLWAFLEQYLPDDIECHVICESFEFRQGKQLGVDLYPCELIGVLKLHRTLRIDMSNQLYFQPAYVQGKKAYFSDKLLKEMGIYDRRVEHGRSALKHLLYWFKFAQGARYAIDLDNLELVDRSRVLIAAVADLTT